MDSIYTGSTETNDNVGEAPEVAIQEESLNNTIEKVALIPASSMMQKTNHNTVVVVAESVTRRPAAAEARKRRKEILLKQQQTKNDLVINSTSTVSTGIVGSSDDAIVDDDNAATDAATLAAVVAATAAAVDASVDLVSTETINIAAEMSDDNENDESNIVPDGPMDMAPFLDDAIIAATAAAVAMNSVTTTASSTISTIAAPNSINTGTAAKKKNTKRKRQSDKDQNIQATDKNDTSHVDFDDDNFEEDDFDENDHHHYSSNNKKTQIRYDPSIPMEKDQLAAWRREARRVRNRESAAASRQRTRGRIAELEDELDEWKEKYHTVTVQLQEFQQQHPQLNEQQQPLHTGDDTTDTTTTAPNAKI